MPDARLERARRELPAGYVYQPPTDPKHQHVMRWRQWHGAYVCECGVYIRAFYINAAPTGLDEDGYGHGV